MNGLYLTPEELTETTGGLKQPAAQIRWLKKYGIRHLIGVDGKPRVREKWLDAQPTTPQRPVREEPDWAALDSFAG